MEVVKIVGLKMAVGEYNRFWKEKNWTLRNGLMLHYSGYTSIMFDRETGRIWADVYENDTDWTDYSRFPEIICVSRMMGDYNNERPNGSEYPCTMQGVRAFVNEQVFSNKKNDNPKEGVFR